MPPVKIVSPSAARLALSGSARVVPVDATWHMPNSGLNAAKQFAQESRIPKSVFFDLDGVCCPNSKYPHMLPSQQIFGRAVSKLGIQKSDTLLVYDRLGIFSGPRAAWTFSLFGHDNVLVLDHFKQFEAEGGVESGPNTFFPAPAEYSGIGNEEFLENYHHQVIEFEQLVDLVDQKAIGSEYILFDARSADRFSGKAPEPRKGLSSGHVPGALSLPFGKVLGSDGHYKSKEELQALFKSEFNLDLLRPLDKRGIIVMCGTGVTAVILRLALERASDVDIPIRVYDGSWTEWAQRAEDMIEKD